MTAIYFRISLMLLLFGTAEGYLFAQTHEEEPGHGIGHSIPTQTHIRFVQNKGQFPDQVRYAADLVQGKLFLEDNTLTYNFADLNDFHDRYFHGDQGKDKPITVNFHAFKAKFVGAQPKPIIQPGQKQSEYHNYYLGNDPNHWASEVPLFGALHWKSLYPGIDMAFFGQEKALKYEFYVAPGADPNQIQIAYEGLAGIKTENGNLHLMTSLNTIIEQKPYVYQEINGLRKEVPAKFKVVGTTVSFEFPQGYNPAYRLIIDPTLVFSTYTGSTADNFGYTATFDNLGNLYAGGIAFGVGYPVTTGAIQTTFGGGGAGGAWSFSGGIDMSISKINADGTAMIWSTYIGGSDNEQPHSLITNNNNELFIYGVCWSNNYPTTPNAFDNSYNGNGDIVITRLNAAGSALIGSTYMGGTGPDGINITTSGVGNSLRQNYGDDARGEVILDDLGNCYIASCTQSPDFPASGSAMQNTFGGGLQDGCVFKLNAALSVLNWATYIGGNGDDACYGLKVDTSNNVYTTGGTTSTNFPTTPGAFQTTYGGGTDGFISRISSNGSALIQSTYIGTVDYDQSYFIELSDDQKVYVYGQSLGAWPVTPGKYSNPGGRQFVAKYETNLATNMWSTVFGNGPLVNISPTAFLVDVCGYVYMSGWGGSVNGGFLGGNTNGMPLTPDAFQATTDGSDVYLIVLTQEAVGLEYGTYLGGSTSAEHVDGGTSRFNKNLEVYHAVCGGCGGNSDFPTQGRGGPPVSSTNNSANCNLAAFKFQFTPQSITANFSSLNLDSCAPFPVVFTNSSQGGMSWYWDFGDGSPIDTNFNTSHIFLNPGTYPVKFVLIDTNACNERDSLILPVTVFANPIVSVSGGSDICNGGSTTLNAFGGSQYNWSPSLGLSNPNIQFPIASPNDTTTYQVIITDTNGCVDTGFVTVNVSFFDADAGPPVSFCDGTGGAQLMAGAVNSPWTPYYYTWWCDSTNTYCGLDSVFDNDPIANPTVTTTYYLQVTDGSGCTSSVDSVVVTVLPIPIVDAGPDQYICPDSAPGAFLTPTISGAPGPFTPYDWSPGVGLNDSTILTPYARPDTTTIYTLVVISSNGCSSDRTTVDTLSSVTVHVKPQPISQAGPDRDLCLGDSLELQGFGFGAGPAYQFEWSPYTGLSDTAIANPMASPPATTEYILTVWSNGCPGSDTVRVNVHTLPTASAGPQTDICLGDSTELQGFASGDSTATYTYNWTPSATLNDPTLPNPLAFPDTSTTYYLIATSQYGCHSFPDSVRIGVRPTPVAEAGPQQVLCFGDSVQLQGGYYYTTTDSANPSQIYYAWTPGSGLLSDSTVTHPWVNPTQSLFYYLEVRHNACHTLDSVLVTVSPDLGATASADTTVICQGDSVQLHAAGGLGGALVTWLPNAGISNPNGQNPMAAPDTTVVYQMVLSEGGCQDTLQVPIQVIPTPEAAYLSSSPNGCAPLTVVFLDNSQDVVFRTWNFGDGQISNQQNPSHTYSQPGDYVVSLTGVNTGGCKDAVQDLTVHVADPGQADFVSDPSFPSELYLPSGLVHFTDRSRGAVQWAWEFGDGGKDLKPNPSHNYQSAGEYYATLTITTEEGCVSTVTKGPYRVVVPELEIPNVFSPNADGINDVFRPQYSGSQPFAIAIYDRWGGLLFESTNKLEYWNGLNQKGEKVADGVYYYQITVGNKDYAGWVTLLR